MNNQYDTGAPPTGQPVHPLEQEPIPPAPAPRPPAVAPRVDFSTSPPVLSILLVIVNVMVFLIDYALGRMGVGYQGVGLLTLLGAKSNAGIIDGQYWRLITPLFLHGGLLHLGLNSYFLYMVGRTIERAYGTARFAAIYFLSGAAGVLMSFIFSRYNSIGASSALFGIIGAWIPLLYRNRKVLANTDRQIKRIVQVILINLLIGLSPGIDNWAHVGGLIGGLALGWFTTPRYVARMIMPGHVQVTDESRQGMGWLATILFAFGLAALTLLIVALRS